MSKKAYTEGSVRADLAGGTLDIFPISLILPKVKTLNIALSLKAKVSIEESSYSGIEIISKDYNKEYAFELSDLTESKIYLENFFQEMTFVVQILDFFNLRGVRLELESGSPAGSGLGGSSSMGVTIYKTICSYLGKEFSPLEAIRIVRRIEGRILNAGVPGYQDYYPAMFGGILCLKNQTEGVDVEQVFSQEFAEFLESHCTLVFSGKSRLSGINNWEVYKGFFDGNEEIIKGLNQIASFSQKGYEAILNQNFQGALAEFIKEGEVREGLFKNILTDEIKSMRDKLRKEEMIYGVKACGAGGGGCFLIFHPSSEQERVQNYIVQSDMKVLEFKVSKPL